MKIVINVFENSTYINGYNLIDLGRDDLVTGRQDGLYQISMGDLASLIAAYNTTHGADKASIDLQKTNEYDIDRNLCGVVEASSESERSHSR